MQYFECDKIQFEGPDSKNPLSFKHFNANEEVGGKAMKDHLRFGAAYWHVMRNELADPFGAGTAQMPWDDKSDSVENALARVDVFFEFLDKIGIDYYCFHDRDIAPELNDLSASNDALDQVVAKLKEKQAETGKKLLWGTACLFAHPRYAHGAATSPDARVYAYAAAQVKKAIEVTKELDGLGYTFWGGREGYGSLINTNMSASWTIWVHFSIWRWTMRRISDLTDLSTLNRNHANHRLTNMTVIPQPALNFLREYNLLDHFKLNIETNHATLAGHTVQHDLTVAANADALGSVDANTGDTLIGWDTDQFPTDIYMTTEIMMVVLGMGGFTTGGLNFDAKRRRESHEPIDLMHAHIGGMDAFARGLKVAHAIREDGRLAQFVQDRYSSYDSDIGAKIEAGTTSFAELEQYALSNGEPSLLSGRPEMLENLVNDFI